MSKSYRFLLAVSYLTAYHPGQFRVSASPVPGNFVEWLRVSFIGPDRGNGSLKDEIECYSLPFGGLGFVSNTLTYYSIFMLGCGLSPWKPFVYPFLCCIGRCILGRKSFKEWIKLRGGCNELIFSVINFLISVPLAVYTIFRCRIGWEFILLAVWKTNLSVTLTLMGLHYWYRIRKNKRYKVQQSPAWPLAWTFLYALGAIVGSVGLVSLVAKTFSHSCDIRIITGVFAGLLGAFLYLGAVVAGLWTFLYVNYIKEKEERNRASGTYAGEATTSDSASHTKAEARKWSIQAAQRTSTAALFLGFEILFAFYSDFILGAIAENWSGAPSSDTTLLFWAYFAAKRLPLLFS